MLPEPRFLNCACQGTKYLEILNVASAIQKAVTEKMQRSDHMHSGVVGWIPTGHSKDKLIAQHSAKKRNPDTGTEA